MAGVTLTASLAGAQGAATGANRSSVIPGTRPAWLAHATKLGPAKESGRINARVYLAPRGGVAAVEAAVRAVSTPGSASYHQFITPAQYQARFGPTAASVSAVRSWLTGAGLHVDALGPGGRYLAVHGTVKQAEAAFATTIARYRHDGVTVRAQSSALSAPRSVAGDVLTVTGVDTTPYRVTPTSKRSRSIQPPAAFQNARPCSAYYGQKAATTEADGSTALPQFDGKTLPYAVCGYTGPQLRGAYENGSALDGSGVTVAITDAYASPTIVNDITTYADRNGDRAYASGQYTDASASSFTHAGQCGPSGWWGEQTLDVEAVHAMAQGANIRYYGAASCFDQDLLDSLAQVVDDDVAQIVTNSWGDLSSNETDANIKAYEQIFMQGALEGISFMFSSGDNGDEQAYSGTIQTDYPTSDPYVTSVGGTSLAIDSSNSLSFETGWGTDKYSLSSDGSSWNLVGFFYGSGGGESSLFGKPDYQSGTTPGTQRGVPDVAMDADPTTGMLVGETQTFPQHQVKYGEYRIGGTSLASPLFAGMTALAIQHSGNGGAGLLNPAIYANPRAFTDVTGYGPDAGNVRVDYVNGVDATSGLVYSVRTFNTDSSLTTGRGWDDVTGLGSPNTRFFRIFD